MGKYLNKFAGLLLGIAMGGVIFAAAVFYPLYAIVKNELEKPDNIASKLRHLIYPGLFKLALAYTVGLLNLVVIAIALPIIGGTVGFFGGLKRVFLLPKIFFYDLETYATGPATVGGLPRGRLKTFFFMDLFILVRIRDRENRREYQPLFPNLQPEILPPIPQEPAVVVPSLNNLQEKIANLYATKSVCVSRKLFLRKRREEPKYLSQAEIVACRALIEKDEKHKDEKKTSLQENFETYKAYLGKNDKLISSLSSTVPKNPISIPMGVNEKGVEIYKLYDQQELVNLAKSVPDELEFDNQNAKESAIDPSHQEIVSRLSSLKNDNFEGYLGYPTPFLVAISEIRGTLKEEQEKLKEKVSSNGLIATASQFFYKHLSQFKPSAPKSESENDNREKSPFHYG